MQREIKFRGKAKDTGEWFYGSYVYLPDSDSHHIIPCGTYKPHLDAFTVEQVEVNPDTVGQFTGSTDRNGKEIYEGDIIEVVGKHKRAVVWDKIGFALMPCEYYHDKIFWVMNLQHPGEDWWEGYADSIEVVGNIHDNPSLLEGGNHAD